MARFSLEPPEDLAQPASDCTHMRDPQARPAELRPEPGQVTEPERQ